MLKNLKELTLLWVKNKHAHTPPMSLLEDYTVHSVDSPYQLAGTIASRLPSFILIHLPIKDLSETQTIQLTRHLPGCAKTPIIAIYNEAAPQSPEIPALRALQDPHLHICQDTDEAIQQLLENTIPSLPSSNIYKAGNIEVDTIKYEIKIQNKPQELTPTEFKLLKILLERKGRVQTREHLLSSVWNYTSDIESRTIDTHIRRLREKLGKDGQVIQTVRGVGYKIPENA